MLLDSTGFRCSTFGAYCKEKHGTKRQHNWLKAHICSGVKTNIVTDVVVTDGTAGIRLNLMDWYAKHLKDLLSRKSPLILRTHHALTMIRLGTSAAKRTFLSKAMRQVEQAGLCCGKRRTTSSNSIEKSLMNITTKDQMLNRPSERSNRSLGRL
jgi:hypothetical protein